MEVYICNCYCRKWSKAHPEFPRRGRQPLRWVRQPTIWSNFPQNLHKNKINWILRGAIPGRPWIRQWYVNFLCDDLCDDYLDIKLTSNHYYHWSEILWFHHLHGKANSLIVAMRFPIISGNVSRLICGDVRNIPCNVDDFSHTTLSPRGWCSSRFGCRWQGHISAGRVRIEAAARSPSTAVHSSILRQKWTSYLRIKIYQEFHFWQKISLKFIWS